MKVPSHPAIHAVQQEIQASLSALQKPVCLVAVICRTLLKVNAIVEGVVRRVALQSPSDQPSS